MIPAPRALPPAVAWRTGCTLAGSWVLPGLRAAHGSVAPSSGEERLRWSRAVEVSGGPLGWHFSSSHSGRAGLGFLGSRRPHLQFQREGTQRLGCGVHPSSASPAAWVRAREVGLTREPCKSGDTWDQRAASGAKLSAGPSPSGLRPSQLPMWRWERCSLPGPRSVCAS